MIVGLSEWSDGDPPYIEGAVAATALVICALVGAAAWTLRLMPDWIPMALPESWSSYRTVTRAAILLAVVQTCGLVLLSLRI
ncbi:MAG: hypothetical protein RIB65_00570 [Ilumatobacter fluminis]|uniref:hypothetical protein n=1 Tax=Ilumatobacter fluminis TaxID=467091 RepID=UPI0032EC2186